MAQCESAGGFPCGVRPGCVIVQWYGSQGFAELGDLVAVSLPVLGVGFLGFSTDGDGAAAACCCSPFGYGFACGLGGVLPLAAELGQCQVFGKRMVHSHRNHTRPAGRGRDRTVQDSPAAPLPGQARQDRRTIRPRSFPAAHDRHDGIWNCRPGNHAALLNVSKAIHDMHQANNDLRRSRQIKAMVRTQLAMVANALPSVPASPPTTEVKQEAANATPVPAVDAELAETVRRAREGLAPMNKPGSVLPPKYDRPRTPTTTRTGNDRLGIER